MNKLILPVFILTVFLPSLLGHFIYAQGELNLLPWGKLFVHFIVPSLLIVFLLRQPLKEAVLDLFSINNYSLYRTIKLGVFIGFAAMAIIFGAHVIFSELIDSTQIISSLSASGINKTMFPLIALWIIFINPLMEEFFWRGFVYRRGVELVSSEQAKMFVLIGSGVIFALHHTIIIQTWFNWWQFLATTAFLAFAGVIFNLMYQRAGNIIPSLIAHFMADLAIIIIGFQIFGFFSQ